MYYSIIYVDPETNRKKIFVEYFSGYKSINSLDWAVAYGRILAGENNETLDVTPRMF